MGVVNNNVHYFGSRIGDVVKAVDRDVVAGPACAVGGAAKLPGHRVQGIMPVGTKAGGPGAAVVVEVGSGIHEKRVLPVPSITATGDGGVGAGGSTAAPGAEVAAHRDGPLGFGTWQTQPRARHDIHGGAVVPEVSHATGAVALADVSHMYCGFSYLVKERQGTGWCQDGTIPI